MKSNTRFKQEVRTNEERGEYMAVIQNMDKDFLENEKTKLRMENSLAQQLYTRKNNLNAYDLKMIFSLYCGFTKEEKIDQIKENNNAVIRKYKIRELLELYNLNPNGQNYAKIKASLKKLLTTPIEYRNSQGMITTVCWIKEFKRSEDDSVYEIEISKGTMAHFMDFVRGTGFLETAISEVLKLKNTETISLFLNILTFEKCKKRTIEIEEVKKIMGLENEKSLKHFTPKVKAALKEIETRTSYQFKLDFTKNGKNITHLNFKISKSPNGKRREAELAKEVKQIEKSLTKLGHSRDRIEKELEEYCRRRGAEFRRFLDSHTEINDEEDEF
jgi:plasmid replication initiation protein